MKNFLMLTIFALFLLGCEEPGCTDPTAVNFDVNATVDDGSCIPMCDIMGGCFDDPCRSGIITSDETWTANHVYQICGKLVVQSGATLTIEPGTIIKGKEGTGTLAAALVVEKGGRINALGTANAPIIFTSILDNIQPGELSGTNLTENDRGLWGGIMLLGNAPISAADGDVQTFIEGIPVTDGFGLYGGNDPNDNSGIMEYVSIRHAGTLIGAGNEINGLTLGGVGSGTSISNIEIVACLDDGIEFFGGTVDVSNLMVGFVGDDGIDIDMNYDGTLENFTVLLNTDGDEAIEIGGPEGVTHVDGSFTLENGTLIMESGAESQSEFKSDAKGIINNVNFNGSIDLAAEYDASCNQLIGDCLFFLLESSPRLVFNSCNRTSLSFSSSCTVNANDSNAAEGLITPTQTAGNTNTDLNWTWMHVNGKL